MNTWQRTGYLIRAMIGMVLLYLAMRVLPNHNNEADTVAVATLAVIDRLEQIRKTWEYAR